MTRDRLLTQLKADEGTGPMKHGRHLLYKCPKGFWTIGYGHNLDAKGLTRAQAERLLDDDLDETIRELGAALPWVADLDPVRQAVLVMMAYQMGVGSAVNKTGLCGFTQFLEAMQAGDYNTASVQGLESKWASLDSPKRALRLMEMVRSGLWA